MSLHQSNGLVKSNACQLYVLYLSLSRCNNVTAGTSKSAHCRRESWANRCFSRVHLAPNPKFKRWTIMTKCLQLAKLIV